MRSSGLRRLTGLVRRTRLRPRSQRRIREAPAHRAFVRSILRERPYCEVDRCWRTSTDVHHVLRKSQGGLDTAQNVRALCRQHHDQTHADPQWAHEQGLLVWSWEGTS